MPVDFVDTTMEPKTFSNRFIFLLMCIFNLIVYQLCSLSIIGSLLCPTTMITYIIDSVQKLEKSGLDIGIEGYITLTTFYVYT